MPRTNCPVTTVTSKYPTAGKAITLTDADTSNDNSCSFTGSEILIIHNTDVGSQTWTLTSVSDAIEHRTGHITTESIAAGAIRMVGPLAGEGWAQSDGKLYFTGSDATVKFGVIKL